MNDVLVGFGVALVVADIPAEGGEKRVDEFLTDLRFLVFGVEVGIEVAAKVSMRSRMLGGIGMGGREEQNGANQWRQAWIVLAAISQPGNRPSTRQHRAEARLS